MTPEEQKRKQEKIERLKWLQEQYKRLQIGATKEEKLGLLYESAIVQKKLEVAQRGSR